MQKVYAEIVPKIVNRLRNILHDKQLTAYYFGGLFSEGRSAVNHNFWATAEAEGVLESGMFFPFGKPARSFESRPSYQLFLLRAELDALFTEPSATKMPFPRTRKPEIVAALREFDNLPRSRGPIRGDSRLTAISTLPHYRRGFARCGQASTAPAWASSKSAVRLIAATIAAEVMAQSSGASINIFFKSSSFRANSWLAALHE